METMMLPLIAFLCGLGIGIAIGIYVERYKIVDILRAWMDRDKSWKT